MDSAFNVERVYRYGSTNSEQPGDCALTSDNLWFVGVFSTDNSEPSTVAKPVVSFTSTAGSGSTMVSPFKTCNHGATTGSLWVRGSLDIINCKYYDATELAAMLDPSSISGSAATDCSTSIESTFSTFFADYDANVYTWTSCDFYVNDFNSASCSTSTSAESLLGITCDASGYFALS